jgi:hypothetical protein
MVMSLIVSHQRHWSILRWLMVFLAGVIPFACLLLDHYKDVEARVRGNSLRAVVI